MPRRRYCVPISRVEAACQERALTMTKAARRSHPFQREPVKTFMRNDYKRNPRLGQAKSLSEPGVFGSRALVLDLDVRTQPCDRAGRCHRVLQGIANLEAGRIDLKAHVVGMLPREDQVILGARAGSATRGQTFVIHEAI